MYKKNKKILYLITYIHNILITKYKLLPNDKITLAISGGQDSISLLFFFFQLQIQWNFSIQISWCNHLWQVDSFNTMREIIKLTFVLQIPLNCLLPSKNILSETEARNWRYQSLKRLLFFYNSTSLITGHTGSDRIETILFNLMKGSGSPGIHPLEWEKTIKYKPTLTPFCENLFLLKKKFVNKPKLSNFYSKKHKLLVKQIIKAKKKKISRFVQKKNYQQFDKSTTNFQFLVQKKYTNKLYQPVEKKNKKNFNYFSKTKKWIIYLTNFF